MGAVDRTYSTADPVEIANRLLAGLARPPRLSVSAWADRYRRLPSKGAAEPGTWRTARVPYLREIMDVLSAEHPARRIVFMKSVQSGGTEAGNNWVGWFIATQRAPMMVVQPTLELAERWSKQRLSAMIEDTPQLAAIVRPARERDSGNTTLLKDFPGGVLVVAGANSAAGLRSMPVRYLMLDEIDAYPVEIEGEGDPVFLAEGRATTFTRRKVFLISTPTIESVSRINREWLASDMRRYHVACPECGHTQPLAWDQLTWESGQPDTVRYACAECASLIEEHRKASMLAGGRWVAEHPEREVVGFHINALYTPPGLGLSWTELVKEFEAAQRRPQAMKGFENLRLAQVTKDPDEKFDWEDIKARADPAIKLRQVPRGCLLITVGVDVQKDRFSILWLGWGRECVWVLDWDEIQGDPTKPEDYAALDARIAEPFRSFRGMPMKVQMAGIDSGNWQDDVLSFSTPREGRGWFGLKGTPTQGGILSRTPSRVDVTWRGKFARHGGRQWKVGTFATKEFLFTRLTRDGKADPEARAIRFPAGLPDDFYYQLTAEIYDSTKRRFIKLGSRRNEAIDTFCYAVAAAHHPLINVRRWDTNGTWDKRAAVLEPASSDLFAAAAQDVAVRTSAPPSAQQLTPPPLPHTSTNRWARIG